MGGGAERVIRDSWFLWTRLTGILNKTLIKGATIRILGVEFFGNKYFCGENGRNK